MSSLIIEEIKKIFRDIFIFFNINFTNVKSIIIYFIFFTCELTDMKKSSVILLIILSIPGILLSQDSLLKSERMNADGLFTSFTTVMILVNLLIISVIINFIIYNRLKKKKTEKVYYADEDFLKLKSAFEGLKEAHDNQKKENQLLSNNVEHLKQSISELEEANIQLLEQKQSLSENQNQLKELQLQKEELFAIAIHDIKNPLSAIKGYAHLLEEYDLNAVEQHEIVQNLISSTDKILDLAFEMNKVVVEAEKDTKKTKNSNTASVYDTIKSVCSQNSAYAKKKKVRLVNQASQNTPKVILAPDKLEEVLFNLINNAIKFSPENTIIQVKSYFNNKDVTIEVHDNGSGIAEEDLPNAFTKGGTLTAKPTGGEKSTGLGLWIVKRIVQDNNGEVWVKSKLNIGSTFGFSLPVVKEE